jgi:hypothetical protein
MNKPEGAINTIKEIEELIARQRASEKVIFYAVTPVKHPSTSFWKLQITNNTHLGVKQLKNISDNSDRVDDLWADFSDFNFYPHTRSKNWLFTNYWFALAYHTRVMNELEQETVKA